MIQKSCEFELNIVDASSVRRYARNEFLPRPMRLAVEQTLLDDDRARNLVLRLSEYPAHRLSARLGRFLLHARETCRSAAHAYRLIGKRLDIAPSMFDFAENRAVSREFVLFEINSLLENCTEALAPLKRERPRRASGSTASLEAQLQCAADCDNALVTRLKRAFAAPSYPSVKARIAGWITDTERDIGKVHWISSMLDGSPVPGDKR